MSEPAPASVAVDPRIAAPSVGQLTLRETAIAFPSAHEVGFPRPAADSTGDGGVDTRRILHALRRRWLPATVLGSLLCGLLAAGVWFLLPRGYEAVVWLRIRDKGGMLGGVSDINEYEAYRKTQLQLLRSPIVLNAALRRPGISALKTISDEDDPVTWLSENIESVIQAESEVLQLKLRTQVAEDSSKIINAVTQCYLDDIVNKDRQDRLGRRDVLEKKYKENQTELRSRRETFNELARTLGTRDSAEVATQRSLLLDHLGGLRRTLTEAERDLAQLDLEVKVYGIDLDETEAAAPDESISDAAVDYAVSRDPEVAQLEDQISDLTTMILTQSQRSARGATEPAVKRMMVQRQQLAGQLEVARERIRRKIADLGPETIAASPSGARSQLSPAAISIRRETLVKTIEETREEFDEVSKEVIKLGQANADLEVRRGEIEQLQRVTDQIGLQLESTALDLTAPPRVTLLEEATVPQSQDFLQRVLLSVLAGAAGFTLGAGAVLLLEYTRNRLSSPDEVPQRAGIRLLGTLPWVGRSRRGRENEYRLAECVDGIRTMVLHGGREAPKVIMVTSPAEREGKSSLAANLAASIARSDRRTLLLEGSLRNPSVHSALQLDASLPGLAEVLRGEATCNDVIQPTAIDGLFAVGAGAVDYAAVNAMARPEFARVIKEFRDSFDHVVVDAGPVLAYADTLLFGQQSDVTIISTMRDVTSVPSISAAADRLRAAGVRVLGCVVCGTAERGPKASGQRLSA